MGRRLYCEKCGYDFEEYCGIGYLYPMIVNEAIPPYSKEELKAEAKVPFIYLSFFYQHQT